MILYAPGLAPVASILMPNPRLTNTRGQIIESKLRTSRNGNQYTYVRKGTDKILSYAFDSVGRGKIVELQEFIKLYQGSLFRIVDHNDVLWLAHLTLESLDDTMTDRSQPVLEAGSFNLEFVGRQL